MNQSQRPHSLFFPILLIGVGVIWLLANMGIFSAVNMSMLFRLLAPHLSRHRRGFGGWAPIYGSVCYRCLSYHRYNYCGFDCGACLGVTIQ